MSLVIEVNNLSKIYGSKLAVSDLSFTAHPGKVTGFLGPNGSGKTTTLKILLGLSRPNTGTALIGGNHYRDLENPMATVGVALDPYSFHPSITGKKHLEIQATAAGISRSRVAEVLDLVLLDEEAAKRKVGGYSLGMRQRLGLATALLGDPEVLVLDEPINGLDPQGIRWIRSFLGSYAKSGRTVLLSSHILSEVQQTVDELVIINQGSLVYEGGLERLHSEKTSTIDAPDREALERLLLSKNLKFTLGASGFSVLDASPAELGELAHRANLQLSLLSQDAAELESNFLSLIGGDQNHV